MNSLDTGASSRRAFLKQGAAAVVAGSLVNAGLQSAVHAAGSDTLRVGLIGCGGRGSGAAVQALRADPHSELTSMADVFADRLEDSLRGIRAELGEEVRRVKVDADHQFIGFDAYQAVIEDSDVVLLTTPPHFRPMQLKAAVEAGKHVFCEKPVAVDAPGIRSVLKTAELAKQKNLSLVSGLCWRYDAGMRATFDQVHKGTAGEITAMQCSYLSNGVWEPRATRSDVRSEMEYQMRNWYYYTWLSGDFNTEQHVHSLDKMQWALHDPLPVEASGTGGRMQRTEPKYGQIYDHFDIVYEYANGVKAFARCRHFRGSTNDISDHIFGTQGRVDVFRHRIYDWKGNLIWRYTGPSSDMYQVEHDEMFKALRAGNPINNGYYMSISSMLAIMGRMVAYTGQTLTWEQAINSQADLSPSSYAWDADPPVFPDDEGRYPVAMPGTTEFV